ncbi:hypothetical protein [Isoalcanivorax indicus]|uniref:hypothetical protein n=1 Tax=Isoalcanivorax indicus TaxID=2202653 RepID=UPI0013C3FDD9|nr:hypothetical protein [Isoalcanivorax indicus]
MRFTTKLKSVRGVLAGLLLLSGLSAQAADYGIGIDVIRVIDQNQDDGMFNVFVQAPAGAGALYAAYASGDNLNIVELAYKHYLGGRMNGAFFQAGVGYYDGNNDDDLGFVGAFGYERKLARHFAVSGAVRMVAGVDENLIGYRETPVYQPVLGFMLAF